MNILLSIICNIFYFFSRINIPKSIRVRFFTLYSKFYNVNLNEVKNDLNDFETFSSFFIRDLKDGVRVPSEKSLIVSPVDGTIIDFGTVKEDTIFSVKGTRLSLNKLLLGEDNLEGNINAKIVNKFLNSYYLSIYLGPGDYHQIHSPITGSITTRVHISGTYYPVGERFLNLIPSLYTINERVITLIKNFDKNNEEINVSVIKVGALNVSSISLTYEKEFHNKIVNSLRTEDKIKEFKESISINKFDKLGAFHIGSTVILLVSGISINEFKKFNLGNKIKVGQALVL